MIEVKVINNLTKTLKGRYDGKDYVFAPNKPVTLSLEAAQHIFGLGDEDKSGALNKLGLLIPGRDTLEEALAALDKITFLEGRTVFDDELPPETGAAPPARAKSGGRPHVAGPGGETAAG